MTYSFPNFNGATVEVWEWISNFMPHFIQIQIQIQNSLLLPIYSFGHIYIQFVFKYNNIHT